ncbi:hypothetical protein H6G76_17740 [Nostoc sp. FACHB-152]|uniref:hypothetical protein n=1 Tax=unclassified Nostoc TaxID=2593658 RepID=UPI0016897791|nr:MULTISPECIES: hypothetical protein [unclassified Nostoc]MBD2448963.1 hypothetical protein [Nostoc sp. FACHB-152]MBD2469431.1 hypothetical protein [Nostoc sp. FACHB-145]
MKNLRTSLLLILLTGFCLPSYGLSSDIKPAKIEAQSIVQGNYQQFINKVKAPLN